MVKSAVIANVGVRHHPDRYCGVTIHSLMSRYDSGHRQVQTEMDVKGHLLSPYILPITVLYALCGAAGHCLHH